ncbi:MAG TPA: glycoside hydrolase family 27 protein [Phycisphaerae bacterium]|nr:glycoside hydrolase family 27 protein [Phycisphaerae bacterium]
MRSILLALLASLALAPLLLAAPAQPQSPAAPAAAPAFYAFAPAPPMGWNSWDCFGAGVTEDDTFANAQYLHDHLLSHGFTIVTIDIQWYEPLAHTDRYRPNAALEMDANGRLLPAANRFPSTKDSRSFKPIADKLHAMGLKFGLHLLRGIPRQAVTQNVPILGTNVHAADIANKSDICRWNTDMYGVDMTKPGAQEYYDSVLALMASWDLDFIKVDDLSAPTYHQAEIEAIRKAIDKTGRPIVFSTSPGATPLAEGPHVSTHANMWRISDDFWDNWKSLKEQFKRLDDWTPFRGPGHFPDADMLPLGNIRTWQSGPNAWTHFTHDEQRTLLTLWCIARSPLILGANLPRNDDFTLSLITNDEVLAVDQKSTNNHQVSRQDDLIVWSADVPNSPDKYVALFNAQEYPIDPNAPQPATQPARGRQRPPATLPGKETSVSISLQSLGLTGPVQVRDLWSHQNLPDATDTLTTPLTPHQAALFRVSPK